MRVKTTVVLGFLLMAAMAIGGARLLSTSASSAAGGSPDASPVAATASPPVATPTAPPPDRTLGDGFVVHRLSRGERAPQFVVVSFDGVGWHEMWQHWRSVAARVPFRFTGFLSGTYLLTGDTRDAYHPPHYPPGTSEIGWNDAAGLATEIDDLNDALDHGMEIGTHFNGHFCASGGLPSGGNTWSTADWDTELSQFFALLARVRENNPGMALPELHLTAADIHGERTPCLEGTPRALYPALRHHDLDYDASFSRQGISWPTRADDGIWQLGMGVFPVHGTLPDGRTGVPVTPMDYNYWFTQRGASTAGVTAADSARDSRQVLDTYRDMYRATYDGNRAPLVLGNHFNDWNDGAYRDALTDFVLETCGRPETQCVTSSDLVAWMEAQRPAVLRRLQALPAELG